MRRIHLPLVLCVSFVAANCASTVHRASLRAPAMQIVSVTSDPAGARILAGGKDLGVTPARVLLQRRDANIVLRIEKDGYEPQEIRLQRTVNGTVGGNLGFALLAVPLPWQGLADNPLTKGQRVTIAVALPLTGIAFDFMTGAAYRLPSQVAVTLTPSARR